MSKGSRDRTKDRKSFNDNFDKIFNKRKEKQCKTMKRNTKEQR